MGRPVDHIAGQLSKITGVRTHRQREPGEGLSNRSPRVRSGGTRSGSGSPAPIAPTSAQDRAADRLGPAAPRAAAEICRRYRHRRGHGDDRRWRREDRRAAHRTVLSANRAPRSRRNRLTRRRSRGRWESRSPTREQDDAHCSCNSDGNRLEGLHQGDFLSRDITGTISGDAISLASVVTERHGDALTYRFRGTVTGDTMAGSLDMGEYLGATWGAAAARQACRRLQPPQSSSDSLP